jgi:phosphohistidine swiveling domain-containing protein
LVLSLLKSEKTGKDFSAEIEKGLVLIIDEASMTGNKQIFRIVAIG